MTGADTLHEFVAGARVEISLTPEVTAVMHDRQAQQVP